MNYKTLDELNDLIEEELKKMVKKGDLSPNELEAANKAVCLMEKIIMLREGGYSEDGSYMGRSSRMYPTYPETSYERGRSPMTGRYVSRDGRYNDSYDRGYSGHSIGDRAVDRLEKMMDDAGSDFERDTIKRYISMIRNDKM